MTYENKVMCRNGLHPRSGKGECLDCARERMSRKRNAEYARKYGQRPGDPGRKAPDWIPTEPLVPIIKAYLLENQRTDLVDSMGIPDKTLERWITGESKYARLDLVDRMLCQMDQTYHFYTTLAEWYFAGLEEADLAA